MSKNVDTFFKWLYVKLLLITIILGTKLPSIFAIVHKFQFPNNSINNALCVHRWVCWALHPHRDRHYPIGSNFWKFYLIKTSFTLGERVCFVKVFRLFRLERIVLVFRVWTHHTRLIDGLIEKLINILLIYGFKILSPKFYTKRMEGGWKWCKVQLRHCKLKSICRHDKVMSNEC